MNEVARLLGVGRGQVYALVRAGVLLPLRVGTRMRFEPAQIRERLADTPNLR
ncbi:MAG: helix-turn-helix domain-containing protein [Thermoleophilia bacterium]